MKSFKQYITETPILDATSRGVSKYLTKQPPPMVPGKLIGRVGSYSLIRPHDIEDILQRYSHRVDDIYHIVHKKKIVGELPVSVSQFGMTVHNPMIHYEHAGKKAKVRNLVPKLYGLLADKTNRRIYSGLTQSLGGASVWERLAFMRPVTLHNDLKGTRTLYDPKVHKRIAYGRRGADSHGVDFTLSISPIRPKRKKK